MKTILPILLVASMQGCLLVKQVGGLDFCITEETKWGKRMEIDLAVSKRIKAFNDCINCQPYELCIIQKGEIRFAKVRC